MKTSHSKDAVLSVFPNATFRLRAYDSGETEVRIYLDLVIQRGENGVYPDIEIAWNAAYKRLKDAGIIK
jgi:hypothetical protein